MKMVKLTLWADGGTFFMNPLKFSQVFNDEFGARIYEDEDGGWNVKESPEEVVRRWEEAMKGESC